MKSSKMKRLRSALIGFLILFYIGYHFYSTKIETIQLETSAYSEVAKTVQAKGFAMRKESLIKKTQKGVISYTLDKGSQVAKGGQVASIFFSEEAVTMQEQLRQINQEIEQLVRLQKNKSYLMDPLFLNTKIGEELIGLVNDFEEQKDTLAQKRGDLLYLMNQRNITLGEEANFQNRLDALEIKKKTLSQKNTKSIAKIISPVSGFFIDKVDGFEQKYDYNNVLNMNLSELREICNTISQADPHAIGRVCEQFEWYLACEINIEDASHFTKGKNLFVNFSSAPVDEVSMKVAAINEEGGTESDKSLVILQCSTMNTNLAILRQESVEIYIQKYKGIRISQNSIHFVDVKKTSLKQADGKVKEMVYPNTKGVYVLHGNELEFVQIFPLYSGKNYIICSMTLPVYSKRVNGKDTQVRETLKTKNMISLHDKVVREGVDLYDGKIVK